MSTEDIYEDPLIQELSRRSFVRAAGVGLAASLLVACGSEAPSSEGEPAAEGDVEVSENAKKVPACETCDMRRKAEENPKSFASRLWKWHTKWCPGWKEYQAYLASQK